MQMVGGGRDGSEGEQVVDGCLYSLERMESHVTLSRMVASRLWPNLISVAQPRITFPMVYKEGLHRAMGST